ncbi:MAG TPA: hypothetical protein VND94_00725 [Terriglobia bacterium]|nr:hypothetical protein [Terriglobia bacterium]
MAYQRAYRRRSASKDLALPPSSHKVVSLHSPAGWMDGTPAGKGAEVVLTFVSMYRRVTYTARTEAASVALQIFHRVLDIGDWLPASGPIEVIGMSRRPFNRRFYIDRPAASEGQPWEIQVRRLTPDTDQWTHNKFYLHSVSEKF